MSGAPEARASALMNTRISGARRAPGVVNVVASSIRGGSRPALAAVVLGLALLAAGDTPAAGPRYWDWPEGRPFAEATFEAAGLDSLGGLTAGPAVAMSALAGPEVTWRVVADGRGGWYLGTGHGGEIHHVATDGSARIVARLESTEVFSLALLPGGDLLAGGGPDGRLVRVTAAGDVTEVGRIEGGYIWGLAVQEKEGVAWLATGSPAAVFRYRWREGGLEQVAMLPAQNAMDVAVDEARGRLLVATQGPGLLYGITLADAAVRLIGDITQDEARRVLRGAGGTFHVLGLSGGNEVLAAASESGDDPAAAQAGPFAALASAKDGAPAAALYRLTEIERGREALVRVWAGQRDLMTAAWSSRWGWVGAGTLPEAESETADGTGAGAAASRAVLLRLTPPWGATTLTSWAGGDILDLAAPGAGDELAVAQAHPAALAVARPQAAAAAGIVTGPPLDGGPAVAWGRLRWTGVPGAGRPRWSVRSGERAQPDESWSGWAPTWVESDKDLPRGLGRYLQWRVELPPAGRDEQAWRVTGVSVSARQPNQPPVIEEFRLEQLRGVKPGGLTIGESIIHQYRSGLRAEFTTQETTEEGWPGLDRADPGRAVRVVSWRASDPNGDRLASRLECRLEGDPSWRPATAPGTQGGEVGGNVGSWDTSGLADGRYELRLVVSDEPDNPRSERGVATRVLGPLVVDNTPPRVEVLEVSPRDGGATIHVRLRASDATGPLAAARLVFPDGKAERLDPQDGVCDSDSESFETLVDHRRATVPDVATPARLRFEVRDLAGNTGVAEAVAR